MRGLLTFLAALVAATPALAHAQAEPAKDAISAVRSFTDAFDRGDEAGMTSVITPDAQVVLVRPQDDGDVVRSLPLADLAARIAGSPADLKEPIVIKNTLKVVLLSGGQIIDDDHLFSVREKPFGQMRADKPGASCNQTSLRCHVDPMVRGGRKRDFVGAVM